MTEDRIARGIPHKPARRAVVVSSSPCLPCLILLGDAAEAVDHGVMARKTVKVGEVPPEPDAGTSARYYTGYLAPERSSLADRP